MIHSTNSTPHLDDAEIVRLLDREHSPSERAHWENHVAACAQCTAEIDRMRADADVVRGWLERAAFELPASPAHTARTRSSRMRPAPWLRAAAVIAFVVLPVAAIAAIPSLRAWVVDTFVALDRVDDSTATASSSVTQAPAGQRIGFIPVPGSFTVRLDAAQTVGMLRVAYSEDAAAELESDGIEAVVAESWLRLRNTAASEGSYALRVPRTVTTVTVRIGPRTIAVLHDDDLRAGKDVPVR
jgi:anti-sigma factor RsiW